MNIVIFVVLLAVVFFVCFWCAIPVMVAKEAKQAAASGDTNKFIASLIVGALLLWIVLKSL